MHSRRLLLALAAIPLLLVPQGCATQADDALAPVESRDADAAVDARMITLSLPADHADHASIQALVEHLEGQADVADAKVAVRQSSRTGEAEVEITLWGQDMPADEVFVADLQAEFPFLVGVPIEVVALDAATQPAPHEGEPADPEQLRAQIIADLRAKGVQGEIEVTITDHPDGRREVEVQVHDDDPPA